MRECSLALQLVNCIPLTHRHCAATVSALVNAEGKTEEGDDALSVSDTYLDLHATILADDRLSLATRALILRVPAGAANRGELRHRYKEIADAGKIMNQAVFDHHGDQLLGLLTKIQKEEDTTAPQVRARVVLHGRAASIAHTSAVLLPPACGRERTPHGVHAGVCVGLWREQEEDWRSPQAH